MLPFSLHFKIELWRFLRSQTKRNLSLKIQSFFSHKTLPEDWTKQCPGHWGVGIRSWGQAYNHSVKQRASPKCIFSNGKKDNICMKLKVTEVQVYTQLCLCRGRCTVRFQLIIDRDLTKASLESLLSLGTGHGTIPCVWGGGHHSCPVWMNALGGIEKAEN